MICKIRSFIAPKQRKGLTLVEMMAVAVILGFLAVMAGQAVYKSIQESRNNTVRADLRTIADAIEVYSIEKNTFPKELSELVDSGHLRDERDIIDKWSDKKETYQYCQPKRDGTGIDGMVYSVGPNGEDESKGTCDDVPPDASGDEKTHNLYHVIRVTQ